MLYGCQPALPQPMGVTRNVNSGCDCAKVVKRTIAHYMDTLSNIIYINQQYYDFNTGMNNLINSYMKSISGSFNETEHTQIMMTLHNYYFTHYGKKYDDKMQQLLRQ